MTQKYSSRLSAVKNDSRTAPENFHHEEAEVEQAEKTPPEHHFDPKAISRAVVNPRSASPATLLAMQQTYGNRAVQRLLNPAQVATPAPGQAVIQRTIDPAVTKAITRFGGTNTTNNYINRYMDLISTSKQRDLIHLWGFSKRVAFSDRVARELELLRYALLVEATRHGMDSAFALKARANKTCTNLLGVWEADKLAAFNNSLSVDIQEDEIFEADQTYEAERQKLDQRVENIKKKQNERREVVNNLYDQLNIT